MKYKQAFTLVELLVAIAIFAVLSMLGWKVFDYLLKVKDAIKKDKYKLERNRNRVDNNNLFIDYVIDETKVKNILLKLTAKDFSEILQNEHEGYEHELLYVFGKDVELLERLGGSSRLVSLYIKFNKLDSCYVIVISFHEQKYPMKYYFK